MGIEPTLLRTRGLSVRLNRSAKTAVLVTVAVHHVHQTAVLGDMTSWGNGNASDSDPKIVGSIPSEVIAFFVVSIKRVHFFDQYTKKCFHAGI